jgi:hypothetical protein
MGPRLDGSLHETYNVYLQDVSSIQVFHSIQLGYQVNRNLQLGVGESFVQNLVEGIRGTSGVIHHRSFDAFDPYLYVNLPALIEVPGWTVSTTASLSLPMTDASYDAERIASISLAQNWNLVTGSDLRFGVNVYLYPQFYSDPMPTGFQDRQTLYASFGPTLGMAISPSWLVSLATRFTIEHRSPDPEGFLHLGPGIPDTAQLLLSFTPDLGAVSLGMALYFQTLIWKPDASTSLMGANASIGF